MLFIHYDEKYLIYIYSICLKNEINEDISLKYFYFFQKNENIGFILSFNPYVCL